MAKPEIKVPDTLKAVAKRKVRAATPPFIDLITNTTIGEAPIEVEIHPWLQANIDSGRLILE